VTQGGDEQPHPLVQQGQRADAIRNLIKSYAPNAKDFHTAMKAMSVGQLEGLVKGYTLNQAAQEHAARMEDLLGQAQVRRENAASDLAAGQALKRYGEFNPMDEEEAPGERLQYMLRGLSGDVGAKAAAKAITALGGAERAFSPTTKGTFFDKSDLEKPMPEGWNRVTTGPNTSQLVYTPKAGLEILRDPETKKAVAYKTTDQRGKETVVKLPLELGDLTTLRDEYGNPSGYYRLGDKTLKQNELMAWLASQKAGTNAPAAATSTNVPPVKLVLDPKTMKLVPQK